MFGSPETQPGGRALEVLLLAAARHAPDRDPQGGHRGGRQPGPRQGGQEQGRRALPAGRVRRRVRRRDLARGRPDRPRPRARPGPEVRLVLLLRRVAPRPGPQQHQAVSDENPELAAEIERKIFAELGIEQGADAAACGSRRRAQPPDKEPGARRSRAEAALERGARRPDRSVALPAPERYPEALRAGARGARPQGANRGRARRLAGRSAGFAMPRSRTRSSASVPGPGALDDERFARRFAEDKRELRGWGPEQYRATLASAGSRPS